MATCAVRSVSVFPKTAVMVMVLTNMQFDYYFSYYRFTVSPAHSRDNECINCCLGFI